MLVQWNINGVFNNFEEIRQIIATKSPDIICLQETHLQPKYNAKLQSYTTYRSDYINNYNASGGVATFVRDSCTSHQVINTSSSIQHITIKTLIPRISTTTAITFCNVYIPPNNEPSYAEISNLISQLNKPFVLLGDMNAHSPMWGSTRTNIRGKLFEKLLQDYDHIVLLNDESPTHFNSYNGTLTSIDLTIASTDIAAKLKWQVHTDLFPRNLVKCCGHSCSKTRQE